MYLKKKIIWYSCKSWIGQWIVDILYIFSSGSIKIVSIYEWTEKLKCYVQTYGWSDCSRSFYLHLIGILVKSRKWHFAAPPPAPPPYKMAKNDIFFETRRKGRKRKKKPTFFSRNFHFLGVFFNFFCFFGCFRWRFVATL